jgi:hypothetical protein
MSESKQKPSAPGFVVLRQAEDGRWTLLGESERKRGLTARAARSHAILDATRGKAKAGEVYAAVCGVSGESLRIGCRRRTRSAQRGSHRPRLPRAWALRGRLSGPWGPPHSLPRPPPSERLGG